MLSTQRASPDDLATQSFVRSLERAKAVVVVRRGMGARDRPLRLAAAAPGQERSEFCDTDVAASAFALDNESWLLVGV